MNNPLDKPGLVFDLDLMNPNPTSSKTKAGPVYRVSFEVERDTWDWFMDAECAGMMIAAKATVYHGDDDEALHVTPNDPKPASDQPSIAVELHKIGFFINPAVVRKIGSDAEYHAWTRRQKCIVCGGQDWLEDIGEGRCEYAHVRRSGDAGTAFKPEYSGVPMCHEHHAVQHQHGESSAFNSYEDLSGDATTKYTAREWFERRAEKNLSEWAHRTFVAGMGHESLNDVTAEELMDWAVMRDIEHLLPRIVRKYA